VTPLAYAKWGGIAAFLIGLSFFWYHQGGLASKTKLEGFQAAQAEGTAKAVLAERASAAATALTDRAAETTHDQDLEAIPLHIRHDAVIVRLPGPAPDCPVPGAKTETGGEHPAPGPIEPGSRYRDIGPGLAAFEARYETALADCRRLDAEWPK
jgi:hypothetical protein